MWSEPLGGGLNAQAVCDSAAFLAESSVRWPGSFGYSTQGGLNIKFTGLVYLVLHGILI